LLSSKYILDALVGFEWPVVVYVALLALIAYGPSVWWCFYASRRWGTGDLRTDLGLSARLADLGWGPVVWLSALGMQLAIAAIVVGFGVPISNNTDAITEVQDDRTYVISVVITAVIAAPIVEEMVFRGVVLRGLRSVMPTVAAVVLQGVLFGAAHVDPIRGVGNVGLVLVLSGVGIAFGGAVALIGRVGPAMVAHALFNGVVLVIVLTGVADDLDSRAPGGSGRHEVAVVDQTHRPDAGGDGDAAGTGPAVGVVEIVEGPQVVGIDDLHVVELGERLGVDHARRR
jgi:membrane protease YdiL (CAAX protease family)